MIEKGLLILHGKKASDGTDGHYKSVQRIGSCIVKNRIVLIIETGIYRVIIRSVEKHTRIDDKVYVCFLGSIHNTLANLDGIAVVQMTSKESYGRSVLFHENSP